MTQKLFWCTLWPIEWRTQKYIIRVTEDKKEITWQNKREGKSQHQTHFCWVEWAQRSEEMKDGWQISLLWKSSKVQYYYVKKMFYQKVKYPSVSRSNYAFHLTVFIITMFSSYINKLIENQNWFEIYLEHFIFLKSSIILVRGTLIYSKYTTKHCSTSEGKNAAISVWQKIFKSLERKQTFTFTQNLIFNGLATCPRCTLPLTHDLEWVRGIKHSHPLN